MLIAGDHISSNGLSKWVAMSHHNGHKKEDEYFQVQMTYLGDPYAVDDIYPRKSHAMRHYLLLVRLCLYDAHTAEEADALT